MAKKRKLSKSPKKPSLEANPGQQQWQTGWEVDLVACSSWLPRINLECGGKHARLLGGHCSDPDKMWVQCQCGNHDQGEEFDSLESWTLQHCLQRPVSEDDVSAETLAEVAQLCYDDAVKVLQEGLPPCSLRTYCEVMSRRLEADERLVGRQLVVYWYDQPVDGWEAPPAADEGSLWFRGDMTSRTKGVWYKAHVSGFNAATSEFLVKYDLDDAVLPLLLPLCFVHWAPKPPARGHPPIVLPLPQHPPHAAPSLPQQANQPQSLAQQAQPAPQSAAQLAQAAAQLLLQPWHLPPVQAALEVPRAVVEAEVTQPAQAELAGGSAGHWAVTQPPIALQHGTKVQQAEPSLRQLAAEELRRIKVEPGLDPAASLGQQRQPSRPSGGVLCFPDPVPAEPTVAEKRDAHDAARVNRHAPEGWEQGLEVEIEAPVNPPPADAPSNVPSFTPNNPASAIATAAETAAAAPVNVKASNPALSQRISLTMPQAPGTKRAKRQQQPPHQDSSANVHARPIPQEQPSKSMSNRHQPITNTDIAQPGQAMQVRVPHLLQQLRKEGGPLSSTAVLQEGLQTVAAVSADTHAATGDLDHALQHAMRDSARTGVARGDAQQAAIHDADGDLQPAAQLISQPTVHPLEPTPAAEPKRTYRSKSTPRSKMSRLQCLANLRMSGTPRRAGDLGKQIAGLLTASPKPGSLTASPKPRYPLTGVVKLRTVSLNKAAAAGPPTTLLPTASPKAARSLPRANTHHQQERRGISPQHRSPGLRRPHPGKLCSPGPESRRPLPATRRNNIDLGQQLMHGLSQDLGLVSPPRRTLGRGAPGPSQATTGLAVPTDGALMVSESESELAVPNKFEVFRRRCVANASAAAAAAGTLINNSGRKRARSGTISAPPTAATATAGALATADAPVGTAASDAARKDVLMVGGQPTSAAIELHAKGSRRSTRITADTAIQSSTGMLVPGPMLTAAGAAMAAAHKAGLLVQKKGRTKGFQRVTQGSRQQQLLAARLGSPGGSSMQSPGGVLAADTLLKLASVPTVTAVVGTAAGPPPARDSRASLADDLEGALLSTGWLRQARRSGSVLSPPEKSGEGGDAPVMASSGVVGGGLGSDVSDANPLVGVLNDWKQANTKLQQQQTQKDGQTQHHASSHQQQTGGGAASTHASGGFIAHVNAMLQSILGGAGSVADQLAAQQPAAGTAVIKSLLLHMLQSHTGGMAQNQPTIPQPPVQTLQDLPAMLVHLKHLQPAASQPTALQTTALQPVALQHAVLQPAAQQPTLLQPAPLPQLLVQQLHMQQDPDQLARLVHAGRDALEQPHPELMRQVSQLPPQPHHQLPASVSALDSAGAVEQVLAVQCEAVLPDAPAALQLGQPLPQQAEASDVHEAAMGSVAEHGIAEPAEPAMSSAAEVTATGAGAGNVHVSADAMDMSMAAMVGGGDVRPGVAQDEVAEATAAVMSLLLDVLAAEEQSESDMADGRTATNAAVAVEEMSDGVTVGHGATNSAAKLCAEPPHASEDAAEAACVAASAPSAAQLAAGAGPHDDLLNIVLPQQTEVLLPRALHHPTQQQKAHVLQAPPQPQPQTLLQQQPQYTHVQQAVVQFGTAPPRIQCLAAVQQHLLAALAALGVSSPDAGAASTLPQPHGASGHHVQQQHGVQLLSPPVSNSTQLPAVRTANAALPPSIAPKLPSPKSAAQPLSPAHLPPPPPQTPPSTPGPSDSSVYKTGAPVWHVASPALHGMGSPDDPARYISTPPGHEEANSPALGCPPTQVMVTEEATAVQALDAVNAICDTHAGTAAAAVAAAPGLVTAAAAQIALAAVVGQAHRIEEGSFSASAAGMVSAPANALEVVNNVSHSTADEGQFAACTNVVDLVERLTELLQITRQRHTELLVQADGGGSAS